MLVPTKHPNTLSPPHYINPFTSKSGSGKSSLHLITVMPKATFHNKSKITSSGPGTKTGDKRGNYSSHNIYTNMPVYDDLLTKLGYFTTEVSSDTVISIAKQIMATDANAAAMGLHTMKNRIYSNEGKARMAFLTKHFSADHAKYFNDHMKKDFVVSGQLNRCGLFDQTNLDLLDLRYSQHVGAQGPSKSKKKRPEASAGDGSPPPASLDQEAMSEQGMAESPDLSQSWPLPPPFVSPPQPHLYTPQAPTYMHPSSAFQYPHAYFSQSHNLPGPIKQENTYAMMSPPALRPRVFSASGPLGRPSSLSDSSLTSTTFTPLSYSTSSLLPSTYNYSTTSASALSAPPWAQNHESSQYSPSSYRSPYNNSANFSFSSISAASSSIFLPHMGQQSSNTGAN